MPAGTARANAEIATVREQNKSQLQLLTIKAKKGEAEVESLRRQLEIKVRPLGHGGGGAGAMCSRRGRRAAAQEADNRELTSICDDLVKQLDARQQQQQQ